MGHRFAESTALVHYFITPKAHHRLLTPYHEPPKTSWEGTETARQANTVKQQQAKGIRSMAETTRPFRSPRLEPPWPGHRLGLGLSVREHEKLLASFTGNVSSKTLGIEVGWNTRSIESRVLHFATTKNRCYRACGRNMWHEDENIINIEISLRRRCYDSPRNYLKRR